MSKLKAAIVLFPNYSLPASRQEAIATGLPTLFAGFGMSFSGHQVAKAKDGRRIFSEIIGHLTPVEGDEQSNDPEGFKFLANAVLNTLHESPIATWFSGVGLAVYDEGTEEHIDPLKKLHAEALVQMSEAQQKGDADSDET